MPTIVGRNVRQRKQIHSGLSKKLLVYRIKITIRLDATPRGSCNPYHWSENFRGKPLKRFLLVSAFLAGEFDATLAFFGLDTVRRAAFAADRVDPGVAL